ncbi:hypothetical protein LBMAG53_17620 [Planctomycetota bacterium]|nr:hypothetical protein LBMAG53_17620 [Planctomycetota bacterium]
MPLIIGGYLEGGKVTGAYAPDISYVYFPGGSPDEVAWALYPYGPCRETGNRGGRYAQQEKFARASLRLNGNQAEGAWTFRFVSSKDPSKALSPDYALSIKAVVKGSGFAGTYSGKIADYPVSGECVLFARNVPAGMIDPLNAFYQIIASNYRVVVEVRAGKAVQALAIASGNDAHATAVHPADASGMTFTPMDQGLDGTAVTLGGQIIVTPSVSAGAKAIPPVSISLDGTVISGAGKLQVKSTVNSARNYPLGEPLMAKSFDVLKASFRGAKPVSPELLAQAEAESQWNVQPAPSESTRYSHRLWRTTSFIYAPWLDFDAVPNAVRYRYTIDPAEPSKDVKTASFESLSPKASLAPVWKDLPTNTGLRLQVTALDAQGAPIGKPQEKLITKRAPFGPEMAVTPEARVLMDLAMRQPYHLTERLHSHLYLTEAVIAANTSVKPMEYHNAHFHFSQQLMAEQEQDQAGRDQYLRLLDTFVQRRLEETFGEFKIPYHYNVVLSGVVQENGRNFLNAYEQLPNATVLDRFRLWVRYFARLQQPSGSWTISSRAAFSSTGGFSLWGNRFLDATSIPWPPFLARLRQIDSDPGTRALERAIEERAIAWFSNNTLRTGFGELLHQQTDPGDMQHSAGNQIEYALYVLLHAPPAQRDVLMASDLMRRIEDLFISWHAVPTTGGWNLTFGNSLYAVEALCLMELYALTGDPLLRAKSEALATAYLQRNDSWHGTNPNSNAYVGGDALGYNRYIQEQDDPDWIVRWVKRDRELRASPPVAIAEKHISLSLDRLIDQTDRVVLDLQVADGQVTQALARTPTWDGPGINFYQPGRLHTRSGKALFHGVDASALKLSAQGLSGTVKLALKPPQGEEIRNITVEINAKRHAQRAWRGAWKLAQENGRTEGITLLDPEITGSQQVFVKVHEALDGGEAWQTWALAGTVIPKNGSASGAMLVNPNAGWTAQTSVSDCELKSESFAMTMNTEVAWHGVAERSKPDAWQCYTYKTTPEAKEALLGYWQIPITRGGGGEKNGELYLNLGFPLRPEIGDLPPDGKLTYETSWKPVTPGKYLLKLTGQRLGNILYGTATVTGPDGKNVVRQFLGDAESIGKP